MDRIHRKDSPLVLFKDDLKDIRGVATDVAGTLVDSRNTNLGSPWPGAAEFLEDLSGIIGPIAVIEHAPKFRELFGRSFHEVLDGPELNLAKICPSDFRLECGYVTKDRPDGYYITSKQKFRCKYEELMVLTDYYPHALGALYARAGLVVLSCVPSPTNLSNFRNEYRAYLNTLPSDDYFARDSSRIAIVEGLQSIAFDESILELIPE